jgi:hypothetical protein
MWIADNMVAVIHAVSAFVPFEHFKMSNGFIGTVVEAYPVKIAQNNRLFQDEVRYLLFQNNLTILRMHLVRQVSGIIFLLNIVSE